MKFYTHWSVKKKLLFVISLLIFVSVTLVTTLTYISYAGDLKEQSARQTMQLLDQLALNTDTYLEELFRLCLSPYYSKRIMQQLESSPQTAMDRLQKQRAVEEFLGEVMTIPRSDILRAHILTDGIYTSSKTRYGALIPADFKEEAWYQEAIAAIEPVFIPVHMEQQGTASPLYVFSIVQALRSMQNTQRVLGVIRVDANYSGIKEVCDRADVLKGSALYILDSMDNRIYENSLLDEKIPREEVFSALQGKDEGAFSVSLGGETYLTQSKPLASTDWRIVAIHSVKELTKDAATARNRAVCLALLCAALGVLISVFFVRSFLKPIFGIIHLMQKVQEGNFAVKAPIPGTDELSYLSRSFNEMTSQISDFMTRNTLLTRQIYEAKYLQKEAQYNALYSQIKPHFLFNALNTIHLLIKCSRNQEASQSIDRLSTLMRGMVNTGRDTTLAAEFKIVDSYLSLQKMRYDTLSYSVSLPSELENYELPAMTVQPLVENALIHGCEPKRGEAEIQVYTSCSQEALCIHVDDNGVGMNPLQLKALTDSLQKEEQNPVDDALTASPHQVDQRRVGLINISRRVQLKYGMTYGLSLQSTPGQGTKVTLRLPLAYEKEA